MKRIATLLTVLVMILCLSGCTIDDTTGELLGNSDTQTTSTRDYFTTKKETTTTTTTTVTTTTTTTEHTTKKQTTTTKMTTTRPVDTDNSRTVYITPTGKKYHFSQSCAGKKAIETTLNKAKTNYGACKKCAH